ncbi:uncharacterized protein TNCV_3342501 [Trichonephila clavipes]|nr:uncharacterized protein TNCV_3342501 [Trichonephila clavipes]
MFLAGHPSQGCFGLQSHCAPCYFFNKASFDPSDFSFRKWDVVKKRSNFEIYQLYKESDIVNFVKIQRIKWASHAVRLDEERTTKKKSSMPNQLAHGEKWLEHQSPDRKAWVRCPKSPNTLRVQTEYVLVKSEGPKVLWAESRVQGTGEYFSPLQFHAQIGEVEIGGVAIYCSFEEFRRANSYCHLYGAQGLGQRQAYF